MRNGGKETKVEQWRIGKKMVKSHQCKNEKWQLSRAEDFVLLFASQCSRSWEECTGPTLLKALSLKSSENIDNQHIILEKEDVIYNWPQKIWLYEEWLWENLRSELGLEEQLLERWQWRGRRVHSWQRVKHYQRLENGKFKA